MVLAGCGDNVTVPSARVVVQDSVSGAMVARSQNYRIVATVTSGRLDAASATHAVKSGVAAQAGAR